MDELMMRQQMPMKQMSQQTEQQQRIAAQQKPPITSETLIELTRILSSYKAGKSHVESRAISAENWWKLRNSVEEQKDFAPSLDFKAKSAWLHNVIVSKHADAMESFPEPNVLPREVNDQEEAGRLSSIIPVILEQNDFEQVYSDVTWQKLKTGTGIYQIIWDASKLNGLGDISIRRVDLLNLFWEPGVTDIQKSKYVFHTELWDIDTIEQQYPETKDKLTKSTFIASKFKYDDSVSDSGKVTVIDAYYKKAGKLHYIKYVNEFVLFSSENEGMESYYDHNTYPFVMDILYPIEGTPTGYGFIDVAANDQEQIDIMKTALVKNTMVGATPRYFARVDGAINEDEFLDLRKPIVHTNSNLGDDSIRLIDHNQLNGNYTNLMDWTVTELRETTGNTETATGSSTSGATAASAIAALQEASGKGSRDSTKSTYRAYRKLVLMVIELMRQFYEMPRQFRITGDMGAMKFIQYNNQQLQPQSQGMFAGQFMGLRIPEFDIKVEPAKKQNYSRITQNELALQFYQMGFFNPQMSDQALATLEMMDFDGKDDTMQRISQNGTMMQQLLQYQQLALSLAAKYEPDMANALSQKIIGQPMQQTGAVEQTKSPEEEPSRVSKARQAAQEASQPT